MSTTNNISTVQDDAGLGLVYYTGISKLFSGIELENEALMRFVDAAIPTFLKEMLTYTYQKNPVLTTCICTGIP